MEETVMINECAIDTNILVSIVVPVYNVNTYLETCLNSLCRQSYPFLQIVVVDDGSTDGSEKICDAYALKDSRVEVVHKENGGLSDARNIGIRIARGKYVAFVDSDDMVSPVFVETMLLAALATGASIVSFAGAKPFGEGSKPLLSGMVDDGWIARSITCFDAETAIEQILYQRLPTEVVFRLYSRDILKGDTFPVGYYYEDTAATYQLLEAAGGMAILPLDDLYAYRIRSDSIIHEAYNLKKLDSALFITNKLVDDINERHPSISNAAASRAFSINRMVYAQAGVDDPGKDLLWKELCKYRRLIVGDMHARKRERIAASIACMGEQAFYLFCKGCRLLGLLR